MFCHSAVLEERREERRRREREEEERRREEERERESREEEREEIIFFYCYFFLPFSDFLPFLLLCTLKLSLSSPPKKGVGRRSSSCQTEATSETPASERLYERLAELEYRYI